MTCTNGIRHSEPEIARFFLSSINRGPVEQTSRGSVSCMKAAHRLPVDEAILLPKKRRARVTPVTPGCTLMRGRPGQRTWQGLFCQQGAFENSAPLLPDCCQNGTFEGSTEKGGRIKLFGGTTVHFACLPRIGCARRGAGCVPCRRRWMCAVCAARWVCAVCAARWVCAVCAARWVYAVCAALDVCRFYECGALDVCRALDGCEPRADLWEVFSACSVCGGSSRRKWLYSVNKSTRESPTSSQASIERVGRRQQRPRNKPPERCFTLS